MTPTNFKRRFMGFTPKGKGKVIVAGMPKSGTTAIASLLAEAGNVKLCSDPFHELGKKGIDFRDALFSGELSFEELWQQHRKAFRGAVIKDPNFPIFLEQIRALLPAAQIVFIVREPLDNIRSILSRLDIPGDPREGIHHMGNARGAWQRLVQGKSPDMPGVDYLEKIAWRWRISADRYFENQGNVRLIRYEDFREDKKNQIEELAKELGFRHLRDISSLVDVQFQPKGKQPESLERFFGRDNVQRIEAIVGPYLKRFGYE